MDKTYREANSGPTPLQQTVTSVHKKQLKMTDRAHEIKIDLDGDWLADGHLSPKKKTLF